MIALQRNKQKMYYSLKGEPSPIYQRDENGNIIYYEDKEGNRIPLDTGEYDNGYSLPIPFKGALSADLEDALTRAWGSDNSNNYATLILSKKACDDNGNPIDFPNGTVIWRKSEITYKEDGTVDETSADYTVDGILDEELNETSYYLRKRK